MPKKIDYARGVHKKVTPEKIAVFMYDDEPGVFYNVFGVVYTNDIIPAKAGFNVEYYNKIKLQKERMGAAKQLIEQELGLADGNSKVIEEYEGFSLVQLNKDSFVVKDPEGSALTPLPLPKSAAQEVFLSIKPPEKPDKKPAVKKTSKSTENK